MDLPKYQKDLQALLELMRRNELAELEIEEEGHRIRLRKTEPRVTAAPVAYAPAPVDLQLPAGAEGQASSPDIASAAAAADDLQVVNSPLVGTFYRAASPEADPFVQEGDRVESETVFCIIEAMKVMNEVPAGVSGVVREVLVKNGEPVEFGQPLFRVDAE